MSSAIEDLGTLVSPKCQVSGHAHLVVALFKLCGAIKIVLIACQSRRT